MDSDKFDSLLDLEDFSDIYASIYGDTDKDNTEATEQQPKTEYNNAATADKTALFPAAPTPTKNVFIVISPLPNL